MLMECKRGRLSTCGCCLTAGDREAHICSALCHRSSSRTHPGSLYAVGSLITAETDMLHCSLGFLVSSYSMCEQEGLIGITCNSVSPVLRSATIVSIEIDKVQNAWNRSTGLARLPMGPACRPLRPGHLPFCSPRRRLPQSRSIASRACAGGAEAPLRSASCSQTSS